MKRLLLAFLLLASIATAQVDFRDGRVWVNGVRRDDTVWLRSCFKLANHLSYTYTGQGGNHWGLASANAWVDEQQMLGFDGCRVLLETAAGWNECETGAQINDGIPQACMWGSEPVDKGQWDLVALRNGTRPEQMHGVAKNSLRWFFQKSQETGFIFELVIDATLKHGGVSQPTQTQVIRQTLAEGYRLQKEFPQANIVMSAINEWDAHSDWTLAELNMAAVRADRWKNDAGQTLVTCSAPPGYEPEQWPCGPLIADGGGGNTFDFDVGPEPGKFDLGAIHPRRDAGWENFPSESEKARLVQDSRGQPWGFTESMFYVEPDDEALARTWFGAWNADAGCCTTSWPKYSHFLAHVEEMGIPWMCVHDMKGVETLVGWPRDRTRVDLWALEHLAHGEPKPPPEPVTHYDSIIDGTYRLVLGRAADPAGIDAYNRYFAECVPDFGLPVCIDQLQTVLFKSDEYLEKNFR